MNAADAAAFNDLLGFLQAIGVGFGDLVILLVLGGFFWLVAKGKVKIGNGNGHYASEDSVKALGDRMDRHFKVVEGVREDLTEMSARIGKVEGQLEQFRSK